MHANVVVQCPIVAAAVGSVAGMEIQATSRTLAGEDKGTGEATMEYLLPGGACSAHAQPLLY